MRGDFMKNTDTGSSERKMSEGIRFTLCGKRSKGNKYEQ